MPSNTSKSDDRDDHDMTQGPMTLTQSVQCWRSALGGQRLTHPRYLPCLATSTPSPPSAVQQNFSLALVGLIRCDLVPHSPFPPSSPRQLSSTTTGSLQLRHDPPPWFPYPPPSLPHSPLCPHPTHRHRLPALTVNSRSSIMIS